MKKERVTFYFSPDRRKSLRVYFSSLEITYAFMNYMCRGADLQYLSYEREHHKEQWGLVDSKEVDLSKQHQNFRKSAACHKITLTMTQTRIHDSIKFDVYFFSSSDMDYFAQYLHDGCGLSAEVSIEAFSRTKDEDWTKVELRRFVPEGIATALLKLPDAPETRQTISTFLQTMQKSDN